MSSAVDINNLAIEVNDVLDPLDLNEINFSCGIDDKETDEFDYDENLFQPQTQPVSLPDVVNHELFDDKVVVTQIATTIPLINKEDVNIDTNKTCDDQVEEKTEEITEAEDYKNELPKETQTEQNNIEKASIPDALILSEGNQTVSVASVGDTALATAQAEWDSVQCVEAGFSQPKEAGETVDIKTTAVISFNEAEQYYQSVDLTEQKSGINTSINRSGFSAFVHLLFGPPSLNKDLVSERDMVFCIAACSFENDNDIHLRMLQTIYRTLLGSKFDCPRFGSHFEQIGFQGNDPATDLRGCGILGLINLLHILTDKRILPLARDIYKLSIDETQNFPFCLMGINITRITLQALREGSLNKECNRRKQVLAVTNDFFAGTYFHMYQIWKNQHKTIEDSGFVIKDVENYAKKNPKAIFKKLETYLLKGTENDTTAKGNNPIGASGDKYVTIDKLD